MQRDAAVLAWFAAAGWLAGAVHELGHALAALACRMRVREVRIGLGPSVTVPLVTPWGRVPLRLGPFPVAGWCRVEDLGAERPAARALVFASGGFANLLVAVLLASVFGYGTSGWMLGVVNFAMALCSLLPVPMLDGWGVLSAIAVAAAGPSRAGRVEVALAAVAVSQAALVMVAGTAAVLHSSWPGGSSPAHVVVALYLVAAAAFAAALAVRLRKNGGRR